MRKSIWMAVLLLGTTGVMTAQTSTIHVAISAINGEKQGWATWKRGFSEADVLRAFSTDMSGVDPLTGRKYDREKAMEGMRRQQVGKYSLSDFKIQVLSPTLVKMRWRATYELIVKKKTVLIDGFINATYRRSSQGWQIVSVSKEITE